MLLRAVRILEEIPYPFKLHSYPRLVLQKSRLGIPLRHDERIRIEIVLIVLPFRNRIHLRLGEKLVIKTELHFLGMLNGHPMNSPFHRTPLPCSRLRCRVVCASDFSDIAFSILDHLLTFHYIGIFEPYFPVRLQTEIFLRRLLHEVGTLNIHFPGERHLARRPLRCGRIQRSVEPLDLPRLPVGYGHLDWVLHHHISVGTLVQVLAHAPLHELQVNELLPLGDTYLLGEHPHGFRSISPSPDAADGRHARVVPAADIMVLHKFQQLPLAHYRIGEVEPCELVLM